MSLETSLSLSDLGRVQGSSNTITWTYEKGDPTPISIFIVNSDVNVLNGAFSVDEYVDVSTQVQCTTTRFFSPESLKSSIRQSYTITNVTLNTGPGYAVEFVNPANYSDVYAISPRFEVKAAGSKFFRVWVTSLT